MREPWVRVEGRARGGREGEGEEGEKAEERAGWGDEEGRWRGRRWGDNTYAFVLESLDDGEGSWIVHVLHDEPIYRLFVLAVYACGFDELGLDARDGVGVGIGVEVDGKRVDHFGEG